MSATKEAPKRKSDTTGRVIGYLKNVKLISNVKKYKDKTGDSDSKLVNIALEFYFKHYPESK